MSESNITVATTLSDLPGLAPELAAVGGLTTEKAAMLESNYWIATVADLLQAVLNAGLDVRFDDAFGASRGQLEQLARDLMTALPQEACTALHAPLDFALGAVLEADDGESFLASPDVHADLKLPDAVTLVEQMPPIFDQGRRGTCVACAGTAVNEWYQARERRKRHLSVQHLYYQCKERDGYPGSGTYLSVAAAVLEENGECSAETWPYNPSVAPGNEGQGPPPPAAAREARAFRQHRLYKVGGQDIRALKVILAGLKTGGGKLDGRPFVFGVPVYPSFMGGETARTGKVLMPLPGERSRGGPGGPCRAGLCEPQRSLDQTARWDLGSGRIGYRFTPRHCCTQSSALNSQWAGTCCTTGKRVASGLTGSRRGRVERAVR